MMFSNGICYSVFVFSKTSVSTSREDHANDKVNMASYCGLLVSFDFVLSLNQQLWKFVEFYQSKVLQDTWK
jgi:hypothetical protein